MDGYLGGKISFPVSTVHLILSEAGAVALWLMDEDSRAQSSSASQQGTLGFSSFNFGF